MTDTAFNRNAAYHGGGATFDTLDYRRMAKVVQGVHAKGEQAQIVGHRADAEAHRPHRDLVGIWRQEPVQLGGPIRVVERGGKSRAEAVGHHRACLDRQLGEVGLADRLEDRPRLVRPAHLP